MNEQQPLGKASDQDPGLGEMFVEDLRKTHFRRDYLLELRQLYQFYLDDESRSRLDRMGRLSRAFSLLGWILKSLMLKLSPARRLAVVFAALITLFAQSRLVLFDFEFQADFRPWGFAILLVVLMLELRDKLLARDEIEVARRVQLALLPDSHPEIPGWEVWSFSQPANDVGGDLVDYLELDGFRHGVVLGDVAGKGLGAALLTAKLQATLRALVPDAVSMDELAKRVNTIFVRDGLDNRYATMFFVEIQHDSGQIRYINAGHNPPFVMRSGQLETLPASSFPLGMLSGAEYEEGQSELSSGQILFVYSDGLSEATNEEGEEFGVERLRRLLEQSTDRVPEVLGRRVLSEVTRFLDGVRPNDDLSMVILAKH